MQDIPSPIGSYFKLAGDTIKCCYQAAWDSNGTSDHAITPAMQDEYKFELSNIASSLKSFPSVVTYILFNEVQP